MDKTGINAYTSMESKSGKFSKLFEFNIILAISKDIIYLMIPPIKLLMVLIFFSYILALKAAHENSGPEMGNLWSLMNMFKFMSRLCTNWIYFLYNPLK